MAAPSVDPALVELFNQAVAHAEAARYLEATRCYEALFALHAAQGLAAVPRFLSTARLQLAYAHIDLKDLVAAEQQLALVAPYTLDDARRYDFQFTRGNVLGGLGQLRPMFAAFVEAISASEDLDDYAQRPVACWTKILGVALGSGDWAFTREVALTAKQVAGVRGFPDIALQAAVCLAEAAKHLDPPPVKGPDADLTLLVLDGAAAGQQTTGRAFRIGSAADCDLVLPGCTAEATIVTDGEGYRLRATGEVFVDGVAVTDVTLGSIEKLVIGGVGVISNKRSGHYVSKPVIHAVPDPVPTYAPPSAVREVGRLVRSRAYAGLALLDDDHVLIVGGSPPNRGAAFASAELFSLALGRGREIPLATAHNGPAIARLADGRILVAGGGTTVAEIYDPRTESWTTAAPLRMQRTSASAVVLPNGLVVVLGGLHENGKLAAEVYDPAKNAWGGLRSPDFAWARIAPIDATRFLVTTTSGGSPPRPASAFYLFDSATWKFEPLAGPAGGRTSPSLCALDGGRVLVTGGVHYAQRRTVECFSAATGTFAQLADMLAPRSTPAITRVASGRVLVVGGASLEEGVYSAEMFDPTTNTWSALPALWSGVNPIGGLPRSDGSAVIVAFGAVSIARETW